MNFTQTDAEPAYGVRCHGPYITLVETVADRERVLAVLDSRKRPVFYLRAHQVVCRDLDGVTAPLSLASAAQAAALMRALDDSKARWGGPPLPSAPVASDPPLAWRSPARLPLWVAIAAGLALCGVVVGLVLAMTGALSGGAPFAGVPRADTSSVARVWPQVELPNAAQRMPAATPQPAAPPRPAAAEVRTPAAAETWPLPPSARLALPAKLSNAAERQLFSVTYSQGHARTLYVFADPACPNCRRLEPALTAAARVVNVVVFPVAVIGRAASTASVTAVLCLPPARRQAAWQALFDIGHDAAAVGETKGDGECGVAAQALGVNEVAYQTYRIPGTPWVIADDGRHVPQAVLREPSALQAFLAETEVRDDTP